MIKHPVKPSNRLLSICKGGLFILFLGVITFASACAWAEDDKGASPVKTGKEQLYNPSESETPLEPAKKNRPPRPSGETVENHYPEGFLGVSAPSSQPKVQKTVYSTPTVPNAQSNQSPHPKRSGKSPLYLLGLIFAGGLFSIIAWADHTYRTRLQEVIAQNNRLLNGEEVDQFINPSAFRIPLFAGSDNEFTEDMSMTITEALSEPITEEISKIQE